jgi:glycine/D-amino acid oxidase-like deaminating enzyme
MAESPRVTVIGGGIVGIATALLLARAGARVVVLERDGAAPRGSTAFAPGFIGLYNEIAELTNLARASVDLYRPFGAAFTTAGGREIATSPDGVALLEKRVAAAAAAGLEARLLDGPSASASLPSFVGRERVRAVAVYPHDGVADPAALLGELREEARLAGAAVQFGREVTDLEERTGSVVTILSDGSRIESDHVVLAVGVWGAALAARWEVSIPLVPVAHPYVYARPGHPVVEPGPFIRWPEHHVYARAHEDTLGIGSYDHPPLAVSHDDLRSGAGLPWNPSFDHPIDGAQRLLAPDARFEPARRINGVFAMTPDNLPFLGQAAGRRGVWVAEALWVTHAGGAARLLADAIIDDADLPSVFAPDRFGGRDAHELRQSALRLYNDIYANDAEPQP